MQDAERALVLALVITGSRRQASIVIIASTAKSSTSVKPKATASVSADFMTRNENLMGPGMRSGKFERVFIV
jgi:hypothetical protein